MDRRLDRIEEKINAIIKSFELTNRGIIEEINAHMKDSDNINKILDKLAIMEEHNHKGE